MCLNLKLTGVLIIHKKHLRCLGLGIYHKSKAQDLPAEVDSYLAVPTRDIDCITFWQVS